MIIQGGSIVESLRATGLLMNPKANVYVVDPSVSAFTLQNAIDLCTAGNGDVIVCLRGGQEVSASVAFDCSGITVIAVNRGLQPFANGEYFGIYAAAALVDVPVAIVTAPCRILGMGFVSRDSRTTFYNGAALLIGGLATAAPFGVHVKGCRFPKWGLDNSKGIGIEGGSDIMIEECDFEGGGADFEAGIYAQGALQNLVVRRNHFRDCEYAVEYGTFAGGGPHAMIGQNVVEDGKLLSAATAAPSIVFDNWLETATDTGSYNDTVDNLNAIGINFSDQHYAE